MGSGKAAENSFSLRNPKKMSKSLGPNKTKKQKLSKNSKSKKSTKTGKKIKKNINSGNNENGSSDEAQPATASQQLSFFLGQFQSANGVQLSSLELESIKDTCILEVSQNLDVRNLGVHMKAAFGSSWKEVLCQGQLLEGKIDPGSPAVLIITTSALRSLELLRGTRTLTIQCHAAKLFSKHMKVEEQSFFRSLGNDENIQRLSKAPAMLNKSICTTGLKMMIRYKKIVKKAPTMLNKSSCTLEFSEHLGNDDNIQGILSKATAMLNKSICTTSLENDDKIQRRLSKAHAMLNKSVCTNMQEMEKYYQRQQLCLIINSHVALLKSRVNIASGTPSRIKKLIDIEALGLSRLRVIVLDLHVDVKGYSLFTLPQVRDEFWDLYKNYIHPRLVQGDLRICLYGPMPNSIKDKEKTVADE